MHVLLVRPDGIGDQILCLPVASRLRRLVPGVRITFLSSAYAASLFDHHPDVDAVVTIGGQEPLGRLVKLFRGGFDVAIFLKPFPRLMAAAWLARVPVRIATGYRWYSVLANRRVYQHRRGFSQHEAEYNLGLLSGLGLEPGAVLPPKLVVTEEERSQAAARLAGLPVPRVILHPGGFAARTWQAAHYGGLARALVESRYGVILTGSAAERAEFLRTVVPPAGVLDVMGQMSLREMMAVVASSDVLVSGATGPAHMAGALGTATVSLFDPRRNNLPARWRPLGTGVVLRPDVPTCERCLYERCGYWDCLDRITPAHVLERIHHMVGRRQPLTVVHV